MPQRPRGTRDFGPAEMVARNQLAQRLRSVFRRYGYAEVQTPVFEELELFTAKSGPGIISELYDFMDKGERHLTLRPELTAPVMRMYHEGHAFDPKPIKWFYHGACYRYDRPQAGRFREFWQFGCEQIGAGTPLAYAELVALAEACFDAAGLRERRTTVGHVAILRHCVDAFGLDAEARSALMRAIDKRDDDAIAKVAADAPGGAEALDRLQRLMAAPDVAAAREVLGGDEAVQAAFDELDALFGHLKDFGVEGVHLDLGIARGLDYYTGIVFETHCPILEAQSQVLGGGGYDLSSVFGGQGAPTMGFGLGFDRTLVALEAQGAEAPPVPGPHVYFGALSRPARTRIVQAVATLRRQGIPADLDLLGRKPGAIAKHADAVGARYLVILGDRDLESGTVQVKELGSGDGQEVALDGLVAWLAETAAKDA